MPRLSAFYGIVVTTYFTDHPPPHFHVRSGEFKAPGRDATGIVLNGSLPRRAASMVDVAAN